MSNIERCFERAPERIALTPYDDDSFASGWEQHREGQSRVPGDVVYVREDLHQGAVGALADQLHRAGPVSGNLSYELGWNAAVRHLRTLTIGGQ